MTATVCALLAIMALFNAKLGKSYLYPPAIYSFTWSLLLLGLSLAGATFYSLSFFTLLIFFTGALLFSFGGFVGTCFSNIHFKNEVDKCNNYNVDFVNKVLRYGLISQIVIAPLYINHLKDISVFADTDSFLMGVRVLTSTGEKEKIGFGVYAYIVAITSFLTMVAFVENDNTFEKKVRAYLFLFIALTYHTLSGARTGSVSLLLAVYFINIFKFYKNLIKTTISSIVVFLIIFTIPAVLLKKGGSVEDSIIVNIGTILESIRNYSLPSLVAFDVNLQINSPVSANHTFRSLLAIANSIGADFELPNPVLAYVNTPIPTNNYSIYYYSIEYS